MSLFYGFLQECMLGNLGNNHNYIGSVIFSYNPFYLLVHSILFNLQSGQLNWLIEIAVHEYKIRCK